LPLLRFRPSVFTTHGLHFLRRARGVRGRVARAAIRAAAGCAARIVCTSEAERLELAEVVGPHREARLVTVYSGVPVPPEPTADDRAAARSALDLEDQTVVALYLGQLEQRKQPLVAVEAASRARENGAPVLLLVAGDGPLADELASRSGPAVRLLGRRDDPERLLTASDVLLLPSAREGLAMAALEAMARGLAVVVSDGPGNPEAVGDAGVVAPLGDVDAWTAALARLASDPDARARLGAAARARVQAEFTVERFRRGIEDVYREALEAR
jgi:glycosyltransferase involved in cell wall biosynthesis